MANLSPAEIARAPGSSVAAVRRLAELGLIRPSSPGRFPASAIEHVRLAEAIEQSGIPLEDVSDAIKSRKLSFRIVDRLFPQPVPLTSETLAEFADRIGLGEAELRRLYVALGLAQPHEKGRIRSDDARLIEGLVRLLAVPETRHVLLRFARLLGQPMRRITEAGTQLFDETVIKPIVQSEHRNEREMGERADEIGANLVASSPDLIDWLFRRHLEESLLGYWTADAELTLAGLGSTPASDHAISFIDLSGFTALTEAIGDAEASRLSERFMDLSEVYAERHDGQIVKLLGDGVMLHFRRPDLAITCALDLVTKIPEAGLPRAHAGVAAGPVIERDGDYFGRTVNLASRLSDAAQSDQILVNDLAAQVDDPTIHLEALGSIDVQGLGSQRVFVARRLGSA